MAVGVRVRDPQTNKILLDLTKRISQTIGYIDTGAVNGSYTIPAGIPGKLSYFIVTPLVDLQGNKGKRPAVTMTGSNATGWTISWSYSFDTNGWGNFAANCRIHYGLY